MEAELLDINPAMNLPRTINSTRELPSYHRVLKTIGDYKLKSDKFGSFAAIQLDIEDPFRIALLYVETDSVARNYTRLVKEDIHRQAARYTIVATIRTEERIIAHIHRVARTLTGEDIVKQSLPSNEQTRAADRLLQSAIDMDCTDVHLVVSKTSIRVDFRICGILAKQQFVVEKPSLFAEALWRRSEHGSRAGYQEGKLKESRSTAIHFTDNSGSRYRIRYHESPITPGDTRYVVMRIQDIDATTNILDFAELGYDDVFVEQLKVSAISPHGIFLFVGPVNSGKSKSLQTTLSYLYHHHNGEQSIVTAEDPVEFVIPGAKQKDVSGVDNGFEKAITDVLRQDVNIFMLGEIRKRETAKESVRVANTGHMTFSTMHAKDPIAAFKLLEIYGVSATTLAEPSMVRGIISQRLVPTLCQSCCKTYEQTVSDLTETEKARYKERFEHATGNLRFRGDGCDRCHDTGLSGRTAIATFLVPDHQLLSYIERRQWMLAELYQRTRYHNKGIHGREMHEMADARVVAGQIDPRHIELLAGRYEDVLTVENANDLLRKFSGAE